MAAAVDFRRITKHSPWQLLTLQIFVCLIAKHVLGFEEVGAIEPQNGSIKSGGSGNVTCRMNKTHFKGNDSTCIYFTLPDTTVPKEQIHIVNDTAAVLMINNAIPGIYRYTCMCGAHGIHDFIVRVGSPPINVTDFACRGYDFFNMTCGFTAPKNFVLTEYKLTFTTASQSYSNDCNLKVEDVNRRVCHITEDYRLIYKFYNFTLTSSNPLGNLTQLIKINHFSSIIPSRPKVDIVEITTNSVVLNINVPKISHYIDYTSGLYYQVRLRPDKFDWIEDIYTKKDRTTSFEIRLDELKYAYRRYEVIVRVRTGLVGNNDTMWSEPFVDEFVTKPKRPDSPPAVDMGSFYIDSAGHTLRLYWKQLPEYEENGPDFKYNITEVRQDGYLLSNVIWIDRDNTSATLKWNSSSRYQFKIRSQNREGQSKNASVINVSQRPEGTQDIIKVYHNQTYTIMWQPKHSSDLVSFTLFWCKSKMESQSECMGTIDFMHFDGNTYNHTVIAQNHALNFAVSTNYKTYSTGMVWAMCTATESNELIKMYPESTPLSSTSIKIKWGTECIYLGVVERYNLMYCVVENNATETSADCKGPEQWTNITPTAKEYTLKNLEPFATYKILISMSTKVKDGPVSDPLLVMTTEDAPSPPYDLKSYNVTSKSAVISWLPPKKPNGNLRSYTVWVNNEQYNISAANDTEGPITYTLQHLRSFTPYKIYVTAHTVKKSHESNDIHLKTKIGFPSTPQSVKLTKRNNGLVLNWNRPDVPSGRVEFYEIRINITRNNKTDECKISGIRGQSYDLKLPSCSEPNYAYTFEVRAVNLAKCNEIDYEIKPDTSISCPRHQGGSRRRRHSKINSSIDITYHISNEQVKPTKGSTTKLIDAPESPMSTCVNDNDICKDLIFTNNMSKCMPVLLEPFYSEWGTSAYYTCGEVQMSKLPFIAISVIFIVLILFAMGYFANKKVEKMRSIGMELPEGLNETTSQTKGITPCEDIMRSEELLYDKENHRLLSQIGNDSGFLNSGQCLDENSVHVCSDHHDSEKSSQSTDSVELTEINSCSYTSSPSQSPKTNIHETVPREEENVVQPVIQATPIQLRPTDNGYIKPMMMTNGYVQAQAFQKPRENPSFNGYTKLDDRGKPIFHPLVATGNIGLANPKVSSSKDIEAPQPMNGNICGYVTHKQLSDFGQHLQ